MNASNVEGLSQRIAQRKQKEVQLKITYFVACMSLGLGIGLAIKMRSLEKDVIAALHGSRDLHGL